MLWRLQDKVGALNLLQNVVLKFEPLTANYLHNEEEKKICKNNCWKTSYHIQSRQQEFRVASILFLDHGLLQSLSSIELLSRLCGANIPPDWCHHGILEKFQKNILLLTWRLYFLGFETIRKRRYLDLIFYAKSSSSTLFLIASDNSALV